MWHLGTLEHLMPPEVVARETTIQGGDGAGSSRGGECGDASLPGVVAGNAGSSNQCETASLEEPI
ncbi:NAC domain-containing protein [Psidium guajava]|nr:NAC domain-containing protein [Psidium guajava]